MKGRPIILIFFLLTVCSSCWRPFDRPVIISVDFVDQAYMKQVNNVDDSIYLNHEQIESFTQAWNRATPVGPTKMRPAFWLYLKLNNDSIRRFKILNGTIKESKDYAYSISDTTLIASFWESE